MAQGLGALAENIKKRKEAQEAAEGKTTAPVAGLKAAAPVNPAPPSTPKPPSKPYVRPTDYDEQLRKELEIRRKKAESR